jgi:Fe-S cluster assembly iron-binding protein IscA
MDKEKQQFFTGDETILEITSSLPEAIDILQMYGLGCAGCHIGSYETLREGIVNHGYKDQVFKDILYDLNEAMGDSIYGDSETTSTVLAEKKYPIITEQAEKNIAILQDAHQKKDWYFKVDLINSENKAPQYFLDFVQKPKKGETIINKEKIKLIFTPESLKHLENYQIDFISTEQEQGFKITKIGD